MYVCTYVEAVPPLLSITVHLSLSRYSTASSRGRVYTVYTVLYIYSFLVQICGFKKCLKFKKISLIYKTEVLGEWSFYIMVVWQ